MNFNWQAVIHYGGALLLFLIGVVGSAGLHIPGVVIDPTTCFTAATAYLGGGMLRHA